MNLGQTVNVHLMMPFKTEVSGDWYGSTTQMIKQKRKFIQEEIWDETSRSKTMAQKETASHVKLDKL